MHQVSLVPSVRLQMYCVSTRLPKAVVHPPLSGFGGYTFVINAGPSRLEISERSCEIQACFAGCSVKGTR